MTLIDLRFPSWDRRRTGPGAHAHHARRRYPRGARPRAIVRLAFVLAVLAASTAGAQAPRCFDDLLGDIGLDGRILTLRSGARFQVVPADAPAASLWLPGLDLIVCERELNVGGTRFTTYEIRARGEPDLVRAFALPAR